MDVVHLHALTVVCMRPRLPYVLSRARLSIKHYAARMCTRPILCLGPALSCDQDAGIHSAFPLYFLGFLGIQ